MFEIGDYVRIKPEFRNPGETDKLYVVMDVNEATQRCWISLAESNMPLNPQESVCFHMIEKAE